MNNIQAQIPSAYTIAWEKAVNVGADVTYAPPSNGAFLIYRGNTANAAQQPFTIYNLAGTPLATYYFNHGNYQTTSQYADFILASKGYQYRQSSGNSSGLYFYPVKE